jgi:conjugal transfer/entry exclusion protein
VKKWIANIAVAASVFGASSAHAALPVTDWVGLVQTTISALQSLKSEVYENTNIVYQYQMMANQLLQATGLDVSDITEQFNSIKDDIGKYEVYGTRSRTSTARCQTTPTT